jgi:hypothetical protein
MALVAEPELDGDWRRSIKEASAPGGPLAADVVAGIGRRPPGINLLRSPARAPGLGRIPLFS